MYRKKPRKKTRNNACKNDLPWLSNKQMKKLRRFFPTPRGKPRVDDQRVLSGIIFVQMTGCRWRDAPAIYGSHKTLYTRWRRWSQKGWFEETMRKMGRQSKKIHIVMIDATYIKVHRTAISLKCYAGELGRLIGKTNGGWNTKLHAICDAKGRIIDICLTGGNASDYKGADILLERLPQKVECFLGDMGYDSNKNRKTLRSKGITPCIPGRSMRKKPIRYKKALYKKRHKIENAFAKIKDWRRVANRYDRHPDMFLSACALAVMVKFWL